MFSLTMPMAMLILFSQVFRSVGDSPDFPAGVNYIDFITPAMLAVATVMAGTNVGVAAAIDHTNGLHDRFRTLAMPRALPGIARTLNEMVFTVARAVFLVGAAALLGFRFHGDAIDIVVGLLVLMTLAGAMSALFGRIGDHLRRPDVVQFAGMMVMMPFMFVSSAFAPLDTMPGWMQAIATANPVNHATDAFARRRPGDDLDERRPGGLACRDRDVGDRGGGSLEAAMKPTLPGQLDRALLTQLLLSDIVRTWPPSQSRYEHAAMPRWAIRSAWRSSTSLASSDRSPVELRRLIGIESNLLAHHLDVLEQAGLISRTRSSGDGRRRYVHLDRRALDRLGPRAAPPTGGRCSCAPATRPAASSRRRCGDR